MIDGVGIKPLTPHADERGYLMELLRADDPLFLRFGQAYVSLNYPGVVRAWHWHELQHDLWVVVRGMIKVALYDRREGSPTRGEVQEVYLGEQRPALLRIPPTVLHGYKTIGTEPSLLINFPNELYQPDRPDEYREPWDSPAIPYDWEIQFR